MGTHFSLMYGFPGVVPAPLDLYTARVRGEPLLRVPSLGASSRFTDETFLTHYAAEQLLFPVALASSPVFQSGHKLKPPSVRIETTFTGLRGETWTYRGPELGELEGLVHALLLGMARGYRPGVELRVAPRELAAALGHRDTRVLRTCLNRLAQAEVTTPEGPFKLLSGVRTPSPGNWSFTVSEQLASFLVEQPLAAVPLESVAGLAVPAAKWLLVSLGTALAQLETALVYLLKYTGCTSGAAAAWRDLQELFQSLVGEFLDTLRSAERPEVAAT